jgi:AraC family cel operon transcriptional repressor
MEVPPLILSLQCLFLRYIDPMPVVRKLRLRDFVGRDEAAHFAVTRAPWSTPQMHTHDFPEIFWIESGRGWHWINDVRREVHERMLVLVRADDRHGFTDAAGGTTLLIANLAFPVAAWNELRRTYFPRSVDPFSTREVERREFTLNTSAWASLLDATAEVRAGSQTPAMLARLLLNLNHLAQTNRPMEKDLPPWLYRASREIERQENFAGGTKAFCRLARRSPAHVARAVRRHLSLMPTDLVNAARIRWAAEQLASTDRPIIDISLDCGFENLGHFYKLFRAARGTSPRRYRLGQQQILGPLSH